MPVFTEQMVSLGPAGGARGAVAGAAWPQACPSQQIQQEQLDSVMDWLTTQPRAAQLVHKDGTLLSTLEHYLGRYLKEVKQHHIKADKR